MSKKTNRSCSCNNVYDAMLEGYAMLEILRDENQQPFDYRFLEVNRQLEHIAGLRRPKIIGQTLHQVLNHLAESWAGICDNLRKLENTGAVEFLFRMDDRHFQARAFRSSEKIIVVMFLEITIQKRAEEALRIHKILFEGAQDIILYMNLDGQVVDSNQRACEAYGYTREQLLSAKIQDIRHSSTLPDYEEQMRQAEYEGIIFESLHVRSDGSTFPVEVSS